MTWIFGSNGVEVLAKRIAGKGHDVSVLLAHAVAGRAINRIGDDGGFLGLDPEAGVAMPANFCHV